MVDVRLGTGSEPIVEDDDPVVGQLVEESSDLAFGATALAAGGRGLVVPPCSGPGREVGRAPRTGHARAKGDQASSHALVLSTTGAPN